MQVFVITGTEFHYTASSHDSRQRSADDRLRFLLDAPQVVSPTKALRIELVHVFRARWTHREPALSGDHFHAFDRRAVARRLRQHNLDWVTGKLGSSDVLRRQPEKKGLFFCGSGCINALIERCAELTCQLGIQL